MASYYWIKLYHEILDDPKMGLMDAALFAFTIKLFLIAGETDKDGELPPVDHIAWRLHLSVDECNVSLHELKRNGIVDCNEDKTNWIVVNFFNRQNPVTVKERVRQYRKRQAEQAKERAKNNVTKRYTDIDIDTDNSIITPAQELLNHFCQLTGNHPRGIIDNQNWEDDSQDILTRASGDITRAKGLVDEAVAILKELKYPCRSPAGLLNTIDNILKPKQQRNGASNGHKPNRYPTPESAKLGEQITAAFKKKQGIQ